jgi:hypothetical protein
MKQQQLYCFFDKKLQKPNPLSNNILKETKTLIVEQ